MRRDQDLLDGLIAADLRQGAVRIVHLQAVDDLSLFERIVIDKPDRLVIPACIISKLAQNHLAAVTRAVDQDTAAVGRSGIGEKFPDQPFGWEWMFNNANVLDTVKKDSIALPAAEKLLAFAQKDSVKYAKQISSSSYFLATYHLEKGDKAKAIDYLKMMMNATADPAVKQSIQNNIDQLSKPTPAAPRQQPKSSSGGAARKSSAG